jgi:hypothetical protein
MVFKSLKVPFNEADSAARIALKATKLKLDIKYLPSLVQYKIRTNSKIFYMLSHFLMLPVTIITVTVSLLVLFINYC